jgi:hypothetical protein
MNVFKDKCKSDEPIWKRTIENLPPGRNLKYELKENLKPLKSRSRKSKTEPH